VLEQYLFNKPAPPQVTKAEVVYKIRGNLGYYIMILKLSTGIFRIFLYLFRIL
jgi:hypothetical protein